MAQLNVKYLDLNGLNQFWEEAKVYIQNGDQAIKGTESDIAGTLTLYGLKNSISQIQGGVLTVPTATSDKIGGILSSGDVTVATNGIVTVNNASQAQKLANGRNITLTGGISGEFTFDGTSDLVVEVAVDPTQHIHEIAQVNGLQDSLDTKLNKENDTANNLTVNGLTATEGSNVDLSKATIQLGENALATTFTEEIAKEKDQSTVATIGFVKAVVESKISSSQAMIYKGVVNTASELENIVEPKIGWTYKVLSRIDFTDASYINNTVDKIAKPGDLIICQTGGSTGKDAKWDIIAHNEDGQVYGPSESVIGNIVTFSNTVGDHIQDSGESISSLKLYTDNAKNSILGTEEDTKDSNTIFGVMKYVDDIVNSSKINTVAIAEQEGLEIPSANISNNTLSIYLPDYSTTKELSAVEDTLNQTITGIDERVQAVETLTAGLDPEVPITEFVEDSVAEAKEEINNTITTLKDNLEGADLLLHDAITALTETVNGVTDRVVVNEGKLADVEITVGDTIKEHLASLLGVPAEEIPNTTLTPYTDEELAELMDGWFV